MKLGWISKWIPFCEYLGADWVALENTRRGKFSTRLAGLHRYENQRSALISRCHKPNQFSRILERSGIEGESRAFQDLDKGLQDIDMNAMLLEHGPCLCPFHWGDAG